MRIGEIRKNLLGCLETALFMPAGTRIGSGYEEMLRSFFVPVLAFPVALLAIYLSPQPGMAGYSENTLSLLHTLRFTLSLGIFLGFVYVIASKIERRDHFFRFIIANNWLSVVPAVLTLPILFMLTGGDGQSFVEAQALSALLLVYTCAMTAFIAACTLVIPIELAGFIAFIGFVVNDSSYDILGWITRLL